MGKQYTPMKIFHFSKKINSLSLDTNKITPPIHVRLKPTNICNHGCCYCAYRVDQLQLGKDMKTKDFIPKEKMRELIDDFIDMNIKAVTFSGGGEPFCYPFLLDTIKKLANTSIKFRCYTNGSRLEGELAEVFAHKGSWMRVSMDGWDDKSYSKYRNVRDGEYTKIMKNLEKFNKFGGKCDLGASLIIDRDNASHIFEMIKNLNGIGIRSVKVSPCIVSNEREENNRFHEPIFDLVKEEIQKSISFFSGEELEIFDSYNKQAITFKKDYSWCPYIQIRPVIGADQKVYACQDKAYNFDSGLIGDISNKRFSDFWFSDKKNFFKINPSRDCNHHCVADKENKLILEYHDVDKDQLEFA